MDDDENVLPLLSNVPKRLNNLYSMLKGMTIVWAPWAWREKLSKQNIMKIKCIHDIKRYLKENIKFSFARVCIFYKIIQWLHPHFAFRFRENLSYFMINHRSISTLYNKKSTRRRRRMSSEWRKNPSWCFSFFLPSAWVKNVTTFFFLSFPFRCHRFNRNWMEKNVSLPPNLFDFFSFSGD